MCWGVTLYAPSYIVAFGMSVLAVDALPVPASDGVAEVWTLDRLDELLAQSDVVAIGHAHRDLAAGELRGPASSLLRSRFHQHP